MKHEPNIKQPKVIFVDAVGTLFGVRGSVGEVYGAIAQRFGVEVSAQALNLAFLQSFQAAPPLIFPGTEQQEIPACEFEWWQVVALRTFQQVGVLHQFSDFFTFFDELYVHFASAEPWVVYPDIRPALERWQKMNIELGVVSNFDSRIRSVLKALDLTQFFTSITISSEVGAAKPDPQIFAAALEKHNCLPEEAWHIGDSYKDDYQGAKTAGLRGIWLKRTDKLAH